MRAASGPLALEAIGISRAVPVLVRRADDGRDWAQGWGGEQDALAQDCVLAHELPLRLVERARLVQDRVGDAHLADVVQFGGAHDLLEALAADAEAPGDCDRARGDPARVIFEVGLLGVHGPHEHV